MFTHALSVCTQGMTLSDWTTLLGLCVSSTAHIVSIKLGTVTILQAVSGLLRLASLEFGPHDLPRAPKQSCTAS